MIYMNGCTVKILEARIIPVWSIRSPGRLTRYYAKPRKEAGKWVRMTSGRYKGIKKPDPWTNLNIVEFAEWHFKAEYAQDGFEKRICDGKWVDSAILRADKGWSEIEDCFKNINPTDFQKYEAWCNSRGEVGKKPIEQVFDPVPEKDIA